MQSSRSAVMQSSRTCSSTAGWLGASSSHCRRGRALSARSELELDLELADAGIVVGALGVAEDGCVGAEHGRVPAKRWHGGAELRERAHERPSVSAWLEPVA